ncbi:uncharacterized protein STEHIDRAFT_149149 [Stereum hirsutum FP-91666 SS1]|uniref:uncharacterized protein n=1 Tax=Stereum hirsutum (strain FP-91666) TaxID=721885 RepID=UPI0004449686|nr:uncharacterized protein STEHIDRAFT_149149 [Stereum hirsutum FP-91666 SS1]EIM82715.1 hypothetical protein STEHIDRAFT_149149 [Stereum hirsutum FP-91666 SS1]
MTVIWGLNLKEIQFWKFKGSYMFNQEYHLRRTKMIVYQMAMIFCVVSESLGTAALSDYANQQRFVTRTSSSSEYNDDFIGIASFNIFVGVFVATIFGAGFFFDLFWPKRHESNAVRLAWKICAILACIMGLADAIALTFIVATRRATIFGPDASEALALLNSSAKVNPALIYRENPRALASVIFIWPGWVSTIGSTFILFRSHKHDERLGPMSREGAAHGDTTEMQNGTKETV